MNHRSPFVRCERLPVLIFLVSFLSGLVSFWLILARPPYDYHLLKQIYIEGDIAHERISGSGHETAHHKGTSFVSSLCEVALCAYILGSN